MRTEGQRESENIEDRRSNTAPMVLAGGGIGTIVLLLLVVALGGDPRQFLQQVQQDQPNVVAPGGGEGGPVEETPEEAEARRFVAVVLADTEDVWDNVFRQAGRTYEKPTLVLYRDYTESACGQGAAAMGPFYCPADQKVYLDLSFFEDMKSRFKAPGDFAQAYVVAHEIGHHVQNLLGISEKVHRMQQAVGSKAEANDLSVRLELQADFLAGVWANHADKMRSILESGDVQEAIKCAEAIGDDRLQREARGRVVPDSFTHGSSEQRERWFLKGLKTGDMNAGDTFNTDQL
jgi:predicted metalloprotease